MKNVNVFNEEKSNPSCGNAQSGTMGEDERSNMNAGTFNAYNSVYSLTVTAIQLIEIYDDQPGRERRLKVLNELAREVNQFTSPSRK